MQGPLRKNLLYSARYKRARRDRRNTTVQDGNPCLGCLKCLGWLCTTSRATAEIRHTDGIWTTRQDGGNKHSKTVIPASDVSNALEDRAGQDNTTHYISRALNASDCKPREDKIRQDGQNRQRSPPQMHWMLRKCKPVEDKTRQDGRNATDPRLGCFGCVRLWNAKQDTLCEPAQSKCTWTFHKSHFCENLQLKCRRTWPRTILCGSLRWNAHGLKSYYK